MEKKVAIGIAIFSTMALYILTNDQEILLAIMAYHLIFSLPLIFFKNELASLTGTTFMRPGPVVNKPSHPGVLKAIGWTLLLIPLLISLIGIVKILIR